MLDNFNSVINNLFEFLSLFHGFYKLLPVLRSERSQLQTANKRDNPYEKLNTLLSTCLKGFHTFANKQIVHRWKKATLQWKCLPRNAKCPNFKFYFAISFDDFALLTSVNRLTIWMTNSDILLFDSRNLKNKFIRYIITYLFYFI